MEEFKISSEEKNQTIDITSRVQQLVHQAGIEKCMFLVFCPHTTASVTINEGADPAVQKDLLNSLEKIVPDINFQHAEGNSDAHLKSSIIGPSEKVLIRNKKLKLGTWQKIFFCEFDGPRTRKIWVECFEVA
ncbi:hypothetical protein AKJ56_00885 [candidate division MSBL1 archaeon SCGC-AAA382N08]|uniref:Secondary thiamine-phosphate synthase enzyme n=1 Tax=candidate division MSBL1 archaeon SCGC-AAA382N08 TaxID=1698285 RepID=A0A133VQ52_9EURY|nr:hypothetical protein AKJ56_00885 [candidate division MSBL1 archaeon SCGC-AAA382N08]